MRRFAVIVVTLGVWGPAPLGAAAAAAEPATAPSQSPDALPSAEAIRAAFDAGKYDQTLKMLGRALPLRGNAAAAYDRHELLMMKGESHLQLKQLKSAGDAFGAAAKLTDDESKAATARATQRVLREAKGMRVQRRSLQKGEKPQSADLLDPAQREEAFRIVYADLRIAAEPKVKEALKARTLKPIDDALQSLSELHDLEVAATGGDAELSATRRDLGERAQKLIGKELDRMQSDVLAIRETANSVVRQTVYTSTSGTGSQGDEVSLRNVLRGLSERDRSDLKSAIETCLKIIPTVQSLAKASGGEEKDADELIDRAKEIGRIAERVLKAKY